VEVACHCFLTKEIYTKIFLYLVIIIIIIIIIILILIPILIIILVIFTIDGYEFPSNFDH